MKFQKECWFTFLSVVNTICIFTGNLSTTDYGKAVLGAGLAKAINLEYPLVHEELGKMISQQDFINFGTDPYGNRTSIHRPCLFQITKKIWMMPVKLGWWEDANLELINMMCKVINLHAKRQPDKTFVMDYPGIGTGRLNMKDVQPILEKQLLEDNIIVITL